MVLFYDHRYSYNKISAIDTDGGKDADQEFIVAVKFIDFVASPQGQKIIQDYGTDKYGEGLYNDAPYAKQYDD
jgi:tungstate transport system substrate-binding protein